MKYGIGWDKRTWLMIYFWFGTKVITLMTWSVRQRPLFSVWDLNVSQPPDFYGAHQCFIGVIAGEPIQLD